MTKKKRNPKEPQLNKPDAATRASDGAPTVKRVPRVRKAGGPMTAEQRAGAQELFLGSFRQLGNVTLGCRVAAISRATLYAWLERDVAFTVRYHQAEEEAADVLEAEAWRRAVKGTEKVIVSMGKVVRAEDGTPLTEREYSDTLLLNLLRARHKLYRPPLADGADVSTIRVIIETDTREIGTPDRPVIDSSGGGGRSFAYGGEIGPPDDWDDDR